MEHDPATRACAKAGCGCGAFDSPWVCNCDHPWADHTQVVTTKQVSSGPAWPREGGGRGVQAGVRPLTDLVGFRVLPALSAGTTADQLRS